MALMDDIRSDLIDESASVSNTLRKAKMLAYDLELPEFREWVDSELNGYTDRSKVPSYRRFRPNNRGTFSGPFQSLVRNMPLPTYGLPEHIKNFAENLIFSQGVGELEGMLILKGKSLQRVWPQEMVILARDAIQMDGGMVLVDAHKPVPAHLISGILDQVKNKLLDFILGLQENNITSENLKNGEVKQETVRNLFNINIYGDHNIVSSGENVQQQASPIRKGDIASLLDYLSKHEVSKKDLRELKRAISAEPNASKGKLGPKVQAWLGEMVSKAYSEAWKITLTEAPKVLMDALRSYYGG